MDLHSRFVAEARRHGWKHHHSSDSRRFAGIHGKRLLIADPECRGWPNLTLFHRETGRWIAVVILKDGEQLRPHQIEWMQLLATCGAETFLLRPSTWDDGARILQRLGTRVA